jgi:hypothetical protein
MACFDEAKAIALALPEAVGQDHHGVPSFRVAGKIFCTLRREPTRLMVKLDPEDQHNFCEGYPDLMAPVVGYWGRKGATYVDYGSAQDALLESLLKLAWLRVAPRRLRGAA